MFVFPPSTLFGIVCHRPCAIMGFLPALIARPSLTATDFPAFQTLIIVKPRFVFLQKSRLGRRQIPPTASSPEKSRGTKVEKSEM